MDLKHLFLRKGLLIGRKLSTTISSNEGLSLFSSASVICQACNQFKPLKRSYSSSSALGNHPSFVDGGGPEPFGEKEEKAQASKHPYKTLFPWKSRVEFHKSLLQNIVHDQNGLVVINKPFGIGVKRLTHKYTRDDPRVQTNLHLRGTGTTDYTLEEAIPFLRDNLEKPELVLVKSTEKQSSGLAIFAENEKSAIKFQNCLKDSKAKSNDDPLYKYRVVAVGWPYTKELSFKERVGLELKSSPLSDIKQPVINREFSKNSMRRGDSIPIHVRVNILRKSNLKTTLLEIQTTSVKWNFLRIYSADILLPILGDHLYSCRIRTIMGLPTKIDPTHLAPGSSEQKLDMQQLEALGFGSQQDSILIPPHIHLHSYTLNNYLGKGQSLVLEAPYPEHFKWTLEQLRLY